MQLLALFGFLFVSKAVSGAPKIIGGSDAPLGKYPYQVSLRRQSSPSFHTCGGSILNERWILTAAHCVQGQRPDSMVVLVGTNLLEGGEGVTYQSEFITWNENFDLFQLINDVALIRVDRDMEFSDNVQPIGLPNEDFIESDYPAVLTGWGSTILGGRAPNNLQEIDLQVISQERCAKALQFPISKSHICTLTKSGEGACHGDSGGPLVADGVQIGIVSFGRPCAIGKPDAFTRVYTFVKWINEQMDQS